MRITRTQIRRLIREWLSDENEPVSGKRATWPPEGVRPEWADELGLSDADVSAIQNQAAASGTTVDGVDMNTRGGVTLDYANGNDEE